MFGGGCVGIHCVVIVFIPLLEYIDSPGSRYDFARVAVLLQRQSLLQQCLGTFVVIDHLFFCWGCGKLGVWTEVCHLLLGLNSVTGLIDPDHFNPQIALFVNILDAHAERVTRAEIQQHYR